MRTRIGGITALVLSFAVAVPAAPKTKGTEGSRTRRELQALQRAVEGAVGQVARPAGGLGGGHLSRAYRLQGTGIVVVLAPRFLPVAHRASLDPQVTRALDEALHGLEESLRRADSPDVREEIKRSMQQLRETRIRLVSRPGTAMRLVVPPEMEAELAAMNAHAEEFRREAEQAQREAERALEAHLRAMGADVPPLAPEAPAPPEAPEAAQAPAAPDAPLAPSGPEAAQLPQPPSPPDVLVPVVPGTRPGSVLTVGDGPMMLSGPDELSGSLLPPMPPAPWEFWFSVDEAPDERSADDLVTAVRDAVAAALGQHRGPWSSLSGEETVSVAVDFVPRHGGNSPRTLIVRAKAADLAARLAGKIDEAELSRRIHTAEY
jgi:hypothetical protein